MSQKNNKTEAEIPQAVSAQFSEDVIEAAFNTKPFEPVLYGRRCP